MNKILFLSIAFIVSNISSGQKYYRNALESILKSTSFTEFSNELHLNSFDIYVSPQLIPFDLTTVKSSILRQKYIKDYSDFSNFSNEQMQIIKHVGDSLSTLEENLNSLANRKNCKTLENLTTGKNVKFVLFFSQLINGNLYAELIPFNKSIDKDFNRANLSYGKALSFLFLVDNQMKIKIVYSGFVNYN